jgi:hypothetical protein
MVVLIIVVFFKLEWDVNKVNIYNDAMLIDTTKINNIVSNICSSNITMMKV